MFTNDNIPNPKVKSNTGIDGQNEIDPSLLVVYTKSSAFDPSSAPVNPQLSSDDNEVIRQFELDNYGEFQHRTARYFAQNLGATHLYSHAATVVGSDEMARKKFHRNITCMRVPLSTIKVHKSQAHGKSFYSGLMVCGNVWVCPVCAAKIQARRAVEIRRLFSWTYKIQRKQIAMISITFPHAMKDTLADNLALFAEALVQFRKANNTSFKKFKDELGYGGLVRALEITYGANGWHPHTHELWVMDFFEEDLAKEGKIKQYLLDRWEYACKKVGLLADNKVEDFRIHSIDIKFRAKDSDYIVKQNSDNDKAFKSWGADKEVASGNSKMGRGNGESPFQLLLNSEKNLRYKHLFIEFAMAIKGKAQLFWSPGLKGQVGVEEKTDEQLAEEMQDKADLLAILNREQWKCVVKNKARAEILNIAEVKGIDGLIEWFADYGLVLDKPSQDDIDTDKREDDIRVAKKAEKQAKKNKRKGIKTD